MPEFLTWSRNSGRSTKRREEPRDVDVRILAPVCVAGRGCQPGDVVKVTRSEARQLAISDPARGVRAKAQLASDAPPPWLKNFRPRPAALTVRHVIASALPCFHHAVRAAGTVETLPVDIADVLIRRGFAEAVTA